MLCQQVSEAKTSKDFVDQIWHVGVCFHQCFRYEALLWKPYLDVLVLDSLLDRKGVYYISNQLLTVSAPWSGCQRDHVGAGKVLADQPVGCSKQVTRMPSAQAQQ